MALLPILKYPNERLHIVAQPVKEIDERIKKIDARHGRNHVRSTRHRLGSHPSGRTRTCGGD